MAKLRTLWVLHTTSTKADADTENGFRLVIYSTINPNAILAVLPFPDLPHDERERGRTDEYRFDVRKLDVDMFGFNEDNFCIQILGNDMWLPRTVWVIGQDATGVRQLLASVPKWPDDLWFSTDPSEGEGMRCLDVPAPSLAARAQPED